MLSPADLQREAEATGACRPVRTRPDPSTPFPQRQEVALNRRYRATSLYVSSAATRGAEGRSLLPRASVIITRGRYR
jgi:hypothetical protein